MTVDNIPQGLYTAIGTITGTLIGAAISLFTTWLNNKSQQKRENQKWRRDKLYEVYEKSIFYSSAFINITKTPSINQGLSNDYVTNLLNSVDMLLVICSKKQLDNIKQIRTEIIQFLQVGVIQTQKIESLRDQIIQLMQDDPRLKELSE